MENQKCVQILSVIIDAALVLSWFVFFEGFIQFFQLHLFHSKFQLDSPVSFLVSFAHLKALTFQLKSQLNCH